MVLEILHCFLRLWNSLEFWKFSVKSTTYSWDVFHVTKIFSTAVFIIQIHCDSENIPRNRRHILRPFFMRRKAIQRQVHKLRTKKKVFAMRPEQKMLLRGFCWYLRMILKLGYWNPQILAWNTIESWYFQVDFIVHTREEWGKVCTFGKRILL